MARPWNPLRQSARPAVGPRGRSDAGFTLIELLVATCIVALMVAVAAPAFIGQQKKALDAAAEQVLVEASEIAEAGVKEGIYQSERVVTQSIAARPSLEAQVVADAGQMRAVESPTLIGVSTESSEQRLVLYAHSESGSVLRLVDSPGPSKPAVTTVGEVSTPGEPFPWKTVGAVLGATLSVLLVVAVCAAVFVRYSRRRAVKRLTAASLAEWARFVEPGVDGPLTPEDGYELLVPERYHEVVDGERVDVEFRVALYRWRESDEEPGRWEQVDDEVTVEDLANQTKTAQESARRQVRSRLLRRILGVKRAEPAYPTLPELQAIEQGLVLRFAADSDVARLAEAWFDFCERVKTQNRRTWSRLHEQRLEDELRQEELARQLKVAELLDGSTSYDELTAALKAHEAKTAANVV